MPTRTYTFSTIGPQTFTVPPDCNGNYTATVTGSVTGITSGSVTNAQAGTAINFTNNTGGSVSIVVTLGATITWTNTTTTANPATPGNWDLGRIPAQGDSIIFTGSTIAPPSANFPVIANSFDSTAWTNPLGFAQLITQNITIASGGTLKIGNNSSNPSTTIWAGSAGAASSCLFTNTTDNDGDGAANATYNGNSIVAYGAAGLTSAGSTFNDTSQFTGGALAGTITWNSSGSINNASAGGQPVDLSAATIDANRSFTIDNTQSTDHNESIPIGPVGPTINPTNNAVVTIKLTPSISFTLPPSPSAVQLNYGNFIAA